MPKCMVVFYSGGRAIGGTWAKGSRILNGGYYTTKNSYRLLALMVWTYNSKGEHKQNGNKDSCRTDYEKNV